MQITLKTQRFFQLGLLTLLALLVCQPPSHSLYLVHYTTNNGPKTTVGGDTAPLPVPGIADVISVTVSPDGTKAALVRQNHNGVAVAIVVLDLKSSKPICVYTGPVSGPPRWNSKSFLAFPGGDASNQGYFLLRATKCRAKRIAKLDTGPFCWISDQTLVTDNGWSLDRMNAATGMSHGIAAPWRASKGERTVRLSSSASGLTVFEVIKTPVTLIPVKSPFDSEQHLTGLSGSQPEDSAAPVSQRRMVICRYRSESRKWQILGTIKQKKNGDGSQSIPCFGHVLDTGKVVFLMVDVTGGKAVRPPRICRASIDGTGQEEVRSLPTWSVGDPTRERDWGDVFSVSGDGRLMLYVNDGRLYKIAGSE